MSGKPRSRDKQRGSGGGPGGVPQIAAAAPPRWQNWDVGDEQPATDRQQAWADGVPVARSASAQKILDAAIAVFAEHGYSGSSVRQVASAAEVSVAGLYHHYASKQDLLYAIFEDVAFRLLVQVEAALALVADDAPHVRLKVMVRAFVNFYLANQLACHVTNNEVGFLDPEEASQHSARRQRLQAVFDEIIDSGIECGAFHPANRYISARAVMVLCRDVARWWKPSGALDANQVGNELATLSLSILGYASDSAIPAWPERRLGTA